MDFKSWYGDTGRRQEISRQYKAVPVILNCYRGFPAAAFQRDIIGDGNSYLISPSKMQEGIIWFTHDLQRGGMMDPVEYATSYAGDDGYLLTYPLQVTKHFDEVKYAPSPDSWRDTDTEIPQDMTGKLNGTEFSPLAALHGAVYELPHGWGFTWQVQKHIGCQVDIRVTRAMLQPVA